MSLTVYSAVCRMSEPYTVTQLKAVADGLSLVICRKPCRQLRLIAPHGTIAGEHCVDSDELVFLYQVVQTHHEAGTSAKPREGVMVIVIVEEVSVDKQTKGYTCLQFDSVAQLEELTQVNHNRRVRE